MDALYEFFSKKIFPSDPVAGVLGSIDLNVFLIQWSGIPLLSIKSESKRFKLCMVIYGIFLMSFVTCIYTGFELHDLILCWDNLNNLTQNTCLSLTHIAGAVKIANAFYRRKKIVRIMDEFKFLTKKYVISEKQKKAFFWGELENKIPLAIYASIVGLTGTMGMVMLMCNPTNIAGHIFPYRAKMPEFLPYIIQLVYMSLAVIVYAIQIVAIDYLNVTLINQIRYQMKTLNIAFESLVVTGKVDIDINAYINSLIKHHNTILRIRKDVEQIFKFPLLLQFFTSLLIFALTGFQATVQDDSSEALLIYFYCGCIFCELFVYCWFGNEVSEQNKTLASCGYISTWYNFDHKYKKTLMIFLMNAQMPFYFTAGGFFKLSLTTFIGILSKSYTYIAVLHQIYAEK